MWRNPSPLPTPFISFIRFGNLLESMFDRWLLGADYRVFTCVLIVRTAGRNAAYYCSLTGDEPALSSSSHPPELRNILETDSTNEIRRIVCNIPENSCMSPLEDVLDRTIFLAVCNAERMLHFEL
jgi:hypothetical protein